MLSLTWRTDFLQASTIWTFKWTIITWMGRSLNKRSLPVTLVEFTFCHQASNDCFCNWTFCEGAILFADFCTASWTSFFRIKTDGQAIITENMTSATLNRFTCHIMTNVANHFKIVRSWTNKPISWITRARHCHYDSVSFLDVSDDVASCFAWVSGNLQSLDNKKKLKRQKKIQHSNHSSPPPQCHVVSW